MERNPTDSSILTKRSLLELLGRLPFSRERGLLKCRILLLDVTPLCSRNRHHSQPKPSSCSSQSSLGPLQRGRVQICQSDVRQVVCCPHFLPLVHQPLLNLQFRSFYCESLCRCSCGSRIRVEHDFQHSFRLSHRFLQFHTNFS